jgi:hypothetical protein
MINGNYLPDNRQKLPGSRDENKEVEIKECNYLNLMEFLTWHGVC